MKIKGKLIIPLVAIIIAMSTLGATPGFAGDTQPSTSVEDSFTYVKPETTTGVPIEDQVGEYISSALGDELQNAGGTAMEKGGILYEIMSRIRNILNSFVKIFESIGLIMGNGGLDLGLGDSGLGGGLGDLFG